MFNVLNDQIHSIRSVFPDEIQSVRTMDDCLQLKSKYLNKSTGLISLILKKLPELSIDERKQIGGTANQIKRDIEDQIKQKEKELEARKEMARFRALDITQPGIYHQAAPIHIIHQVVDECIEIFESIGFVSAQGPDVELDYYNFTALNFPPDHPAMEMHDTFYVADHHLLRTHTSPVQVRVMEKTRPPIAIISPGACFRSDTPDATHSPYFHQIEGLCVAEGISFSDLKGVLTFFYQSLLSPDVKLRFRPSYFPFTEPSTEVDISCIFCKGQGCRICKSTGWIESCGAGMVDPGVFKFVDYDPEKFSGYAFGIGIERLAMLKYQIHDIRLFFENDLNFLKQF